MHRPMNIEYFSATVSLLHAALKKKIGEIGPGKVCFFGLSLSSPAPFVIDVLINRQRPGGQKTS